MQQQQQQIDQIRASVLSSFQRNTDEDDAYAFRAFDRLDRTTGLELLKEMASGEWKFGDEGPEFARRILEQPTLRLDRTADTRSQGYRDRFDALLAARAARERNKLSPNIVDDLAFVAYDTSMDYSNEFLDQELANALHVEEEYLEQTAHEEARIREQNLTDGMVRYIAGASTFPGRLVTKIFAMHPQFLSDDDTEAVRDLTKMFLSHDLKESFGTYHRLTRQLVELLPHVIVVKLDRAKKNIHHALTDAVGKNFASYVTAFF